MGGQSNMGGASSGNDLSQMFMGNQPPSAPQLPTIQAPANPGLPNIPPPQQPMPQAPAQMPEEQYVRMLNPQSHANSITGMGSMNPIAGMSVPADQVDRLRDSPGFWGVGNPPDQTIQSGPFAGINPSPGGPQGMPQPSQPQVQPRYPSPAQLLARAINQRAQGR